MSAARAEQLWHKAGLQLCRGDGPTGLLPARDPDRCGHAPPNHVWAYDFVFDACANGQQIKGLTVVDEFTPMA